MFENSKSSFGNDEFLINDDKYNFINLNEDKMISWDKIIQSINSPSFQYKIDEKFSENQADMHSKIWIDINDELSIINSSKNNSETLNKLGEDIEKQSNFIEELKEGSTSICNKQTSIKILDLKDNLLDQRQDKDSSELVLNNSEKENDSISYLKKLWKPSHTSNPRNLTRFGRDDDRGKTFKNSSKFSWCKLSI